MCERIYKPVDKPFRCVMLLFGYGRLARRTMFLTGRKRSQGAPDRHPLKALGRLWKTLWKTMATGVQNSMNYWDQLRNYLQQKVSAQEYDNWLSGTAFAGLEEGTLSIAVPDRSSNSTAPVCELTSTRDPACSHRATTSAAGRRQRLPCPEEIRAQRGRVASMNAGLDDERLP